MNVDPSQFGCRGHKDRIGVLIAQLGTPDAPTPTALKPYLRQFLGDPRVIEGNRFIWWLVLNGIVLVTRPKRSARLYQRIWGEKGSPLLTITQSQTAAVRQALSAEQCAIDVEFGMRYGKPSIESAIDRLIERGCARILLFPMYPQYSATTSASTYDAAFAHILKRRWVPTLRVAEPYYTHPSYLQAMTEIIQEHYRALSWKPDKLVLSYHGIPEKYVARGDPYCCQCTETTEALLRVLPFKRDHIVHTYQSRFGRDPWLRPYTDVTFKKLVESGVRNIAVFAPGFTADCLETLDELGNEGSHQFKEAGGENYTLIPCLNDHPRWIAAMKEIIEEELGSWLRSSATGRDGSCLQCPLKTPLAQFHE